MELLPRRHLPITIYFRKKSGERSISKACMVRYDLSAPQPLRRSEITTGGVRQQHRCECLKFPSEQTSSFKEHLNFALLKLQLYGTEEEAETQATT